MKHPHFSNPKALLEYLNATYGKLHVAYEDLFWKVFMGERSLDSKKDKAQKLRDTFRTDEELKKTVDAFLLKATGVQKERLSYWARFFGSYQVPHEAKELRHRIAELETKIETVRATRKEGYIDPYTKEFVEAPINKLRALIATHVDEKIRKASFEAIQKLSETVLPEYVQLVRMRNEYAELLGYEDFYAYKLHVEEGMTKKELFDLFDTLYEKTKYAFEHIRMLEKTEKKGLRLPWNYAYMLSGAFTKEEDPYFSFENALMHWGQSFAALGIDFKKGTLVLDLLERKGKYNNGFCHWPETVSSKNGKLTPGRAHFTCNVVLGTPGQGSLGMLTLFHEGGHAAHYLNSRIPDICMNHEYQPSSTAWAETQSQFLDTIFSSIEWRTRYAQNAEGEKYPLALYERKVKALNIVSPLSPMGAMQVSEFEKRIYESASLSEEKVLKIARSMRDKYSDLRETSIAVLEVPHIYAWESACSYHAYLLAELALEQWRDYFYKSYGYIVDNPKVGKEMEKVWALAATKPFPELVKIATGKKLSAASYIKTVSQKVPSIMKEANARIARLSKVPRFKKKINLNATIKMVDGKKTIATNKSGFESMAHTYGKWLKTKYPDTTR